MILMIDNYDSFTYNLVQYLGEMGEELEAMFTEAKALAVSCVLSCRLFRQVGRAFGAYCP